MTGSFETTCPACGGPAHTNDDDGMTYCDDDGPSGCRAKAKALGESGVFARCEYKYFKPANRRGGV